MGWKSLENQLYGKCWEYWFGIIVMEKNRWQILRQKNSVKQSKCRTADISEFGNFEY